MRRAFLALALLLCAASCFACGGLSGLPPIPPPRVTVSVGDAGLTICTTVDAVLRDGGANE